MPKGVTTGERGKLRTGALLLVGIVFLAYARTLTNPFVWDDVAHIAGNPGIESWRETLGYFGRLEGRYYRPLIFLSYAVDRALWGAGPFGFHATNLLLHLLNLALLISTARRTGVPASAALVAGALFALHPLQTEAVAYVSGRTDLLVAAAALLAWRVVLADLRPILSAPALAGAVALAVLAKESGFALLLFLPWAVRARAGGWRARIAVLWPAVLVAAALLVLRPGFPDVRPPVDLLRHFGGVGLALAGYGRLLVWPAGLGVDRLTELPASMAGVALGAAVLAAMLVALGWALFRGSRAVADWSAWAAAFYLPVSNLLPLDTSVGGRFLFTPEHNLYVPMAGIAVLIGLGWQRVFQTAPVRRRRFAAAAGLLALGALAAATFSRTADWRSEERLFAAAVAAGSRSPRVYYNLGNIRLAEGDAAAAATLYETALGLAPEDGQSWTNLGVARQRRGDLDGALDAYEHAVRLLPSDATVWRNLAAVHAARGDLDAARRAFSRALESERR